MAGQNFNNTLQMAGQIVENSLQMAGQIILSGKIPKNRINKGFSGNY